MNTLCHLFKKIFQVLKFPYFWIILMSLLIFCFIVWGLYFGCIKRDGLASCVGFEDKKIWDVLELIIIPLFLAVGAWWFTNQQKIREMEIAEDRQRENILRNYLDKMTDLLITQQLIEGKIKYDDPVIKVSQVRTISALRELDTTRQNYLLQFLRDTHLDNFILAGASLENFNLENANLTRINLSKTNLKNANLKGANLNNTNFSMADLEGAHLEKSIMKFTNLNNANLENTHWKRVNIEKNVYFDGTNLKESDISNEQLKLSCTSLSEKTIMPDGSKYDGRFYKTQDE